MMLEMWFKLLLISLLVTEVDPFVVEGIVRNTSGEAIEGARISLTETSEVTVSDASGAFKIEVSSLPTTIRVSRPGYTSDQTTIMHPPLTTLSITLVPLQMFKEEITVTAAAPNREFAPESSASSSVTPEVAVEQPEALADIVEQIPGVAHNGQGGLLQVYSIRGISGHRIQTSIAGAKLTSERRAGVSGSFLDPFLVGAVHVLRGSASTYHGSGALGGVVETSPRHFDSASGTLYFDSNAQKDLLAAGWGNENLSVGIARRSSNNAVAADGTILNTHFTQYSATFHTKWERPGVDYELWLIPSVATNIGKSNSDFPFRTTSYPEEKHFLGSFRMRTQELWSAEVYFHPHDLETLSHDQESAANVFNDTVDYGARVDKQFHLGPTALFDVGFDYSSRRSVDSFEERRSSDDTVEVSRALDGAREDELGLKASAATYFGKVVLEGGAQFSWLTQKKPWIRIVGQRGLEWLCRPGTPPFGESRDHLFSRHRASLPNLERTVLHGLYRTGDHHQQS